MITFHGRGGEPALDAHHLDQQGRHRPGLRLGDQRQVAAVQIAVRHMEQQVQHPAAARRPRDLAGQRRADAAQRGQGREQGKESGIHGLTGREHDPYMTGPDAPKDKPLARRRHEAPPHPVPRHPSRHLRERHPDRRLRPHAPPGIHRRRAGRAGARDGPPRPSARRLADRPPARSRPRRTAHAARHAQRRRRIAALSPGRGS